MTSTEERPNVVVILLDDLGFAELGCFGSSIETPAIDALARGGLRYTNFHTTPLCSPTRASLLTGRNHHAVGMGMLADTPASSAGYAGRLPRSAATVARHLRDAGYGTFAVGKWHLAPRDESGPAGPYDRWPLQSGFDRFYGFLRGLTDQWFPNLVRDNSIVEQPYGPAEGYHLTEDLTSQAIAMLQTHRAARPEHPFFLYFAPGAVHSPHQAPSACIERYRGHFDHGWDVERERRFERQIEAGLVPPGTLNTERPPSVPAWDDLDEEARRVYARQMEVFAGFLTHTDHELGRLVEYLRLSECLENTVIYVTSDNGAAHHPSRAGTWAKFQPNDVATMASHVDEFGGVGSHNHYARGWTWAGTTPFRYWKGFSWLGGVRTPLVVHWPAGIAPYAEPRRQFVHAIDIMPSILELARVSPASSVDGVAQQPIEGASMLPTFADPNASSPRTTQYFEMQGSRAIYHDGWKATTDHLPFPEMWEPPMEGSRDFAADRWSLFDLGSDFSEAVDVAEREPARLARLVELWEAEAEAHGVLPLSDAGERPDALHATRTRPAREIFFASEHAVSTEDLLATSFDLSVELDAPAIASGVLWAHHPGAYTFTTRPVWACHVVAGIPVLTFGLRGEHRIVAEGPLVEGEQVIEVRYRRSESGEVRVTLTTPPHRTVEWSTGSLQLPPVSELYVGRGTGVAWDDYDPARRFDGAIRRVVIERRGSAS